MTLQRINILWQLFSPPRRPHHHHHHHHHHHQVHSTILMIRTTGGRRGGDYFPALRCSHRHHPQLAASSSYNRWTLGCNLFICHPARCALSFMLGSLHWSSIFYHPDHRETYCSYVLPEQTNQQLTFSWSTSIFTAGQHDWQHTKNTVIFER